MLVRMLAALAALVVMAASADARRVALVVGQNAYPGGTSATVGLPPLDNPVSDARSIAALVGKHGFEVIGCDGTGNGPGCFDLDGTRFLKALDELARRAAGADLALVFFAGHGTATPEGNILTPIDAKVNCATGAVTHGVPMERIMAATEPARNKLVILDACRDNPLDDICPNLKGKKLSFARIEAGAMRGLLLVTSTQFGRAPRQGRPRQRRAAARPFHLAQQGRRRACCSGQPAGRARRLSSLPRHQGASRQGRPRQCRLAARPLCIALQDRRRTSCSGQPAGGTWRLSSLPRHRRTLAKIDPGNAEWQRDLSVSRGKIGDVLRDQGDLPAALDAFQASLAISERLAKADPGNAGWQRDLALGHGRIATVLARQGARDEAARVFEQGRAIIVRLRQLSPDDTTLPKDLAWLEDQLAALGK